MNRDELGAVVMSLLGIITIIAMLAYSVDQYADFAYSSLHGQHKPTGEQNVQSNQTGKRQIRSAA